jgi:plasmid stability protein
LPSTTNISVGYGGAAVRGRSIEDVAARLRAKASEHHDDGAEVRAVLMACFVEDREPGFGVLTWP